VYCDRTTLVLAEAPEMNTFVLPMTSPDGASARVSASSSVVGVPPEGVGGSAPGGPGTAEKSSNRHAFKPAGEFKERYKVSIVGTGL
jgi:hypothetical protein